MSISWSVKRCLKFQMKFLLSTCLHYGIILQPTRIRITVTITASKYVTLGSIFLVFLTASHLFSLHHQWGRGWKVGTFVVCEAKYLLSHIYFHFISTSYVFIHHCALLLSFTDAGLVLRWWKETRKASILAKCFRATQQFNFCEEVKIFARLLLSNKIFCWLLFRLFRNGMALKLF